MKCRFAYLLTASLWLIASPGRAAEPPIARAAAAGRPRLFLRQHGLDRLRIAIRGSHRRHWEVLKAAVDKALTQSPPEYRPPRVGGDATRPGTMNDEMLWQREYGYELPGMALAALLDDEPRYLELVRKWALKPGQYPLWGAGIYENTGLAAKHQLFGLALAYDWLYGRWSAEDRISLQKTLREHGRILYEAAEGINDRGWWKTAWRQNHAWNGYQALAVTALALAGEEPAAGAWLDKALWGGRNIIAELPDDGSYEEGIPYWGYGMEALMRFIEATRPYCDENFHARAYFRNTHLFRLYMAAPAVAQLANFGDGRTADWHDIGSMMLRLSSEYRNGVARWLADSLPGRGDIDAACWSLLWYDPSVESRPPQQLPLSHLFPATGFAGARTHWGEDALTVHMRAGKADVSHSHLDVGNFLVNAGGEWLLRDYGYGKVGPGYFNKNTLYLSTGTWGHNCLVIGERHQKRDDSSIGTLTDTADGPALLWWRTDLTACYEGAQSVTRDLVLVRPGRGTGKWGALIVRDRARTTDSKSFDFMLQPGGSVEVRGDTFRILAKGASMAARVLAPQGARLGTGPGFGGNINVDDPLSIRISAPAASRETEFLVVMVPLAPGEAPPEIRAEGPRTVRIGRTGVAIANGEHSAPRVLLQ